MKEPQSASGPAGGAPRTGTGGRLVRALAKMKTNKHKTLLLIRKQEAVHSRDLVAHFDYSPATARSYLSYLGGQGLLERVGAGHCLSERGRERLDHFNAFGCSDVACPLCEGKIGSLTSPHCNHRMSAGKVRIRKKKDFLLVVRHPGVCCDGCLKLIYNPAQAELLGIKWEK